MLTLLDENYKLKQQKKVAVSNKLEDTIYASYKKLYYQNKNLEKQNLELANAVTRGSLLSISNFKINSYKARNSGKLVATDVVSALKAGNGVVELKALNGQVLTVMQKDGKIWLKDTNGNYSQIVATDVMGSNGVIHVIDSVVMPK